MGGPVVVTTSPDRTVAIVTLSLAGTGTDTTSTAALAALRNQVIPDTIGRVPGTHVYVAGMTAGSVDFNQTMKQHLPLRVRLRAGPGVPAAPAVVPLRGDPD